MVTALLALLLAGLGSAVLAEMVMTLVALPTEVAVPVIVKVARLELVIVPRLKVTDPFPLSVQLPSEVVADKRLIWAGRESVKTTSDAVSGPRFVTEMV